MRWIIFLSLIMLSCEPSTSLIQPTGTWEISWLYENEVLSGTLGLRADHSAELTVNGSPESALIQKKETHLYTWKKSESNLTLTRIDNGLSLDFQILSMSYENVRMLFVDEIIVILNRK